MKFLKYLFVLILTLIVIGGVYLATLDGTYDVKESRVIHTDPAVIFNEINDYKNWQEWSPWYEQDTTVITTYSENSIGKGASYSWTSKKSAGGKLETVVVEKPKSINQVIYLKTPFGEIKSDMYWRLEAVSEGTNVTWGMKGEMAFFIRFMTKNMKTQLEPLFERGLELLEETIQRELKIYNIKTNGIVDYSGGFYVYTTTSSKIDEIVVKYPEMLSEINDFVTENSIRTSGVPFTIYHKFDEENGTAMYSVCYPVSERIITPGGSEVLTGFMERGKYFKTTLTGSYSNSKEAWDKAYGALAELDGYKIKTFGEPFEMYVNSPLTTPNPADLITEIYIPVEKIAVVLPLETEEN